MEKGLILAHGSEEHSPSWWRKHGGRRGSVCDNDQEAENAVAQLAFTVLLSLEVLTY